MPKLRTSKRMLKQVATNAAFWPTAVDCLVPPNNGFQQTPKARFYIEVGLWFNVDVGFGVSGRAAEAEALHLFLIVPPSGKSSGE